MRVAILDLGTNTFNLLIGEIDNGRFDPLYQSREIAKLGEGGLDKNIIAPDAFQRGITAIGAHMQTIAEYKCDKLKAIATSGIRSTTNGKDFIAMVKLKYQLDVEVISGDREAELIWKGVGLCSDYSGRALIMDIGGGSTEFIIADREKILWKSSFKLGASRLKEIFKPKDPFSDDDVNQLLGHFKKTLKPLAEAYEQFPVKMLIGSSGSFDTFADMMLYRYGKEKEYTSACEILIELAEFDVSHTFLMQSTFEERLQTPGIIPMRADMIVVSSLLTKYIIDLCRIEQLSLSKFALKEGLMSELI